MTDQLQQAAQQAQMVLQEHIRNNYELVPQEMIDAEFALRAAIEEALAQPKQEPVAEYRGVTADGHYIIKPMGPLTAGMLFYTAPQPQPMQEPDDAIRAALRDCLAWGRAYGEAIPARQWDEMREQKIEQHMANLITAPQPQREPMTEEEKLDSWIKESFDRFSHADCYMRGIDAAERFHQIKEKNGGQE
jgi:hypothetical protein